MKKDNIKKAVDELDEDLLDEFYETNYRNHLKNKKAKSLRLLAVMISAALVLLAAAVAIPLIVIANRKPGQTFDPVGNDAAESESDASPDPVTFPSSEPFADVPTALIPAETPDISEWRYVYAVAPAPADKAEDTENYDFKEEIIAYIKPELVGSKRTVVFHQEEFSVEYRRSERSNLYDDSDVDVYYLIDDQPNDRYCVKLDGRGEIRMLTAVIEKVLDYEELYPISMDFDEKHVEITEQRFLDYVKTVFKNDFDFSKYEIEKTDYVEFLTTSVDTPLTAVFCSMNGYEADRVLIFRFDRRLRLTYFANDRDTRFLGFRGVLPKETEDALNALAKEKIDAMFDREYPGAIQYFQYFTILDGIPALRVIYQVNVEGEPIPRFIALIFTVDRIEAFKREDQKNG